MLFRSQPPQTDRNTHTHHQHYVCSWSLSAEFWDTGELQAHKCTLSHVHTLSVTHTHTHAHTPSFCLYPYSPSSVTERRPSLVLTEIRSLVNDSQTDSPQSDAVVARVRATWQTQDMTPEQASAFCSSGLPSQRRGEARYWVTASPPLGSVSL